MTERITQEQWAWEDCEDLDDEREEVDEDRAYEEYRDRELWETDHD